MSISPIKAGIGIFVAASAVCTLLAAGMIWENVPANKYVVIQSPVAGDLNWQIKPGVAWQGFGNVTAYDIRMMYDFREKGYNVQFNDGGHGTIFGSIQCELPGDIDTLTSMHRKFPTQELVESGLVKTSTEGAIYLVGTLMSSRESYAEKKNDLIHYVTDQVQNGPYRTRQKREWIKDPVTNESKEVIAAEIVIGKDGNPERQEKSTISAFGLRCYQFIVNRIAYDPAIEQQIKQQQAITMNVQTSVADKVLAEQRALTAEANGRANATEAKWKQETIKATETTRADQERQVALIQADREKQVQVTNASRDKEVAETQGAQRLAVADLDRKAAEQTKLQQILLGEGESARKKLVIEADGALEAKLAAYTNVMPKIFEALRGTAFVPSVVMGGGGSQNTNAGDLINLLTAKTAKDLALDITMQPGGSSIPLPRARPTSN
jgi:hypothetical protein